MVAYLLQFGLPRFLLSPLDVCNFHDRGQSLTGVHQMISHNKYEDFHKVVFDSGKNPVMQSAFYHGSALLIPFLIYVLILLLLPDRNQEIRWSFSQIILREILGHFHDRNARDSP